MITGELVIIESPYSGNVERNITYVRRAMADCFKRGEFPFASHALYTQPGVLDDDLPSERALGIDAGLAWGELARMTVVYTDYGISRGMTMGMARADAVGRPIEVRTIGVNP